ncbi:hypothetical protein [Streptomyces sp. AgN23]|nr:hypothetical protein [Streptomyces sp. AgN23]
MALVHSVDNTALTGTSVDNAMDWTKFVKRNWTEYIASRRDGS